MKPSVLFAAALALGAASLPAADPALTIYNQNFAVIRETVPLDLKAGINEARFAGVTAQVEPDSVVLRDPTGKTAWQILEQNYRNDPVSQGLMLSLFEGREIEFVTQEPQKADRVVVGKVIRSGYVPVAQRSADASDGPSPQGLQPIIEVGGKLQFTLPGEPRFPALGADTVLKPTLTWKLNAAAPVKLDAELAFVTGGFTWEASYNIVSPETGDAIDLVGWITMKNTSGATFSNARIKLMAGDVNKIVNTGEPIASAVTISGVVSDPQFSVVVREKSFDEFHLYTLANATTLRDQETKQVEFIRATGIQAARLYIYDPVAWQPGNFVEVDPDYGTQSGKKVAVFREFKNSEANHLGLPLPKGRVRFYAQDDAAPGQPPGALEFVGENNIDHTPKDELVRLKIGESFDLVGERKRVDLHVDRDAHWATESFEIKLRNRKKTPVEIRVVEHLYRWANWGIKEKSQDFTKTDAQTIEFRVPVKPDEEQIVTYQVRYTW